MLYAEQDRLPNAMVAVGSPGHAGSVGAGSDTLSDVLGPDASRMVWAFAARQFRA